MDFSVTFFNVLLTLLYILPGFILGKTKLASGDHLSTLSAVLIYICSPCMIFNSFISLEYSLENLKYMGLFFLFSFLVQVVFILIIYVVLRNKYSDSKYRIFTVGSVLGNVGFFGLPIVKAIFPDNPEVMCYSSIFVVSMNILVFTVGVFCLTGDRKFISLKSALLNPSSVSFFVSLPFFLFGGGNFLPELLLLGISLLGKMTTPLCMLILGIRLAYIPFKKIFLSKEAYIISFFKLIVFPLFSYLCVHFLPVPESFKASALVLSAVPCASVILAMAEMHQSERELSANCLLLSTLLCILTIPLMTFLPI